MPRTGVDLWLMNGDTLLDVSRLSPLLVSTVRMRRKPIGANPGQHTRSPISAPSTSERNRRRRHTGVQVREDYGFLVRQPPQGILPGDGSREWWGRIGLVWPPVEGRNENKHKKKIELNCLQEMSHSRLRKCNFKPASVEST